MMIVGPGWTAIVFDQTQTLNKKYSASITLSYNWIVKVNNLVIKL